MIKPDYISDDGSVVLYCGDCLGVMPMLDVGSIDMVLTDPPYGTTACKWDSIIPLQPMWEQLKRLAKTNAAIVMTASQPFTSVLASSNLAKFRYCWVWDKRIATGFNYARFQPMRQHEDVLVFYGSAPTYHADGEPYSKPLKYKPAATPSNSSHMTHTMDRGVTLTATHKKKRSILRFDKVRRGLHPTQKPVALMEYLIKTYTNEGDTVLDFTMGSGTTGIACRNTARKFIGIELDRGYFDIAVKRIEQAFAEQGLFTGKVAGEKQLTIGDAIETSAD